MPCVQHFLLLNCHGLRPRCLSYMFICDDGNIMTSYLRFREELGMNNKASKHIFVTSNPNISDAVYSLEEIRYHGHAGRLQDDFLSINPNCDPRLLFQFCSNLIDPIALMIPVTMQHQNVPSLHTFTTRLEHRSPKYSMSFKHQTRFESYMLR